MKSTIQMLCAAALLALLLSGCRTNNTTNPTTEMTTVPVTTETTMPETQPTTLPTTQPTTQPTTEMTTEPADAATDTTENDINGRAAQPTSASTPQNSVAGKIATVPSTSASKK